MGSRRGKRSKKRSPVRAEGSRRRGEAVFRAAGVPAAAKTAGRSNGARQASREPVTPRRLWLFRAVAVVVIPALVLLLVEVVLRAAGYGFPTAAAVRCDVRGKTCYCDNLKFGWRFFPRNIAREAEPYVFAADKSDDTYRIFILGSSAAQGVPDAAFCFARFLRVMLEHKYPGVEFEVVNTAMAAINSHVVREIAKDCTRHEPDLFIMYLGNNEVVGPYGAGTVFTPLSGNLSLIRAAIALKATKLGQLLTALFEQLGAGRGMPMFWEGMEMFLEKQVRAGDPQLEKVYQYFAANLTDIRSIARDHRVGIVFCTVGSNLKDSPPFASLHRADLTQAQKNKWQELYERGMKREAASDYSEAVSHYLAAAEVDDRYADLQFRLGRCYWEMASYDKAKQRYVQARELDTLRFRADARINGIIRGVVGSKAGEGVYLADAVKAYEDESPYGTPGEELFYEHVHMNFRGTYVLARVIFEQVQQVLPEWVKKYQGNGRPVLTEEECAQRLVYTGWDRYKIADEMLNNYIKKPPFTNQVYHQEQVARMEQELKELKALLSPEALQGYAAQYRQAIENAPGDWRLHWKYGKLLAEDLKDYEAAVKQYRLVQEYVPHSYTAYTPLGAVYRGLGDLDGVIEQYLKAIEINPACSEAHYHLGWAYEKQGRTDKAIKHYRETMRLQPNAVSACNNLAEILLKQGRVDEAVETCRRGLRFVPDSPILRCNLGLLLDRQGHRDDAIRELRMAAQLDPNSVRIRKVLDTISKRRN
jgi:tetratricopeptide (TPR) repeat protein